MSNKMLQFAFMVFTLVQFSPARAQSRDVTVRGTHEKKIDSRVDDQPSAIELLNSIGIVPDFQFLPEDLAALPASFWPVGLSYDAQTGEVVFQGERLSVRELPEASVSDQMASTRAAETTNVVYVEEVVVTRMVFAKSFVSDRGDIMLSGPDGDLRFGISAEGRFVAMVHPPVEDVDAFYPITYFIEMRFLVADPNTDGAVACCDSPGTGGGYTTCKCDTAGCGGGCDDTKCQGLKTCSGGCGSCAYTACTECY